MLSRQAHGGEFANFIVTPRTLYCLAWTFYVCKKLIIFLWSGVGLGEGGGPNPTSKFFFVLRLHPHIPGQNEQPLLQQQPRWYSTQAPPHKLSHGTRELCVSGYELTLHISCLPHSPCTDKCQNKGHIVAGFPDSPPNYNRTACTPGCWSHSNSLHSGHTSSQSLPVCTDTCLRCYTADSSTLKQCVQVRQMKSFSILPGDIVQTVLHSRVIFQHIACSTTHSQMPPNRN